MQSQAETGQLEGVSSSVHCSGAGVGGCGSKLRMWECERDCGDKNLEELVQDLLPLGVLIDTVNSWLCS